MSDNDKKNVDETVEDGPETTSEEAEETAQAEDATEGGADADADAGADEHAASDDSAASGAAAAEGDSVTQDDAPAADDLAAAEAEAAAKGLEEGDDFRNLVANAAGITGPDQPRPMHAEADADVSDDALRARGMERDHAPNLSLLAMMLGFTLFLGLSAVGVLHLWRYATDSSLEARNWSVVDPALAALAERNRELRDSAGPAHGEEQEGEVRFPAQRAASLLLENPEWLARHPLAPEPAAEPATAPAPGPTGVDSGDEEAHDAGGEASEEQAGTPPPPGADPQDEPTPVEE